MKPRSFPFPLFACVLFAACSSAFGSPITWSGATNGIWGTDSNWSGTGFAPTSLDDLTILGPGNIAGALNINIAAAASANSINFTDTAAVTLTNTTSGSNQTLTLGAGGLTTSTGAMTIGSATANQNVNIALGASQTWNVGSGGLTVTNVIGDGGSAFGITKSGTGTLTLSGANTFTGGVTLSAGTINFSNNSAFGTGAITSNGGTIKNTTGVTTTNNLVVNSGSTTLDVTGGNWNLNGNISGSGDISRGVGANLSLYLGGDNSGYTGTFTIQNNGNAVVRFNNSTAGSASGKWAFNNATAGRTTLSWSGTGTISFGSMTGAGDIRTDIAGAKTISAGALGLSDIFSGTITNGTGTIALTKVGAGTMTLSGANTFSGATTVSAGKLNLSNQLALQNSVLTPLTGGVVFDSSVVANAFTVGGLNGAASGNDLVLQNNAGSPAAIALTVGNNNSTASYAGVISGSGSLVKTGTGTQTLAGSNTYSGLTGINGGVVQISAANHLGNGSATNTISFNGGTLESTANTYDLGSNRTINLLGNGVIQSDAGTLTVSGGISTSTTGYKKLTVQGAGDTAITGAMTSGSGAVGLVKLGTGTLTLSGGGTLNAGIGGYGVNSGFVIRGGTTKITLGAYSTNTEVIVGGVTVNGETGVNTNLTLDGGSLTITNYLSLGRGNGTGSVSSDIVLNNSAAITTNNFSAGFNAGSALNLPKGTFTLNGTSSFTVASNGAFNLAESAGSNMTLTLKDSATVTVNGSGSTTNRNIGNGGTGVLTLNGSGATFTDASTGVLNIGLVSGTGTLNVNAGTFNHSNGEIVVAGAQANGSSSATGTINVAGGTLNTKALTVGRNSNDVAATLNGAVNVTSGTINVTAANSLIGWRGIGTNGTLNISGGTFNQATTTTANMEIGTFTGANGAVTVSSGALNFQNNSALRFATVAGTDASTRTLTISGGNVTFYSDAGTTVGGTGVIDLMTTANANGTNTINLDGGTLAANQIKASNASGTRVINFNGGTLKAAGGGFASTFLASGIATAANVRNGGAIIDTNGNNVTVGQALVHSTIGGDNATDGGLTKQGTGTLTLSNANTYTGKTTVSNGTLALDSGGSIANSSEIALNGGNFNVSAVSGFSIGSSQKLTGNGGSVTGDITVNGTLAIGNSPGSMTFNDDLTIGSSAVSDFEFTNIALGLGTYDLAQSGIGSQTVTFGGTLNLLFTGGTYANNASVQIFNFENYSGNFTTLNFSGLGIGQSATFNSSTGFVTVVPEPGAALFGGIGMLMLLRRRRIERFPR